MMDNWLPGKEITTEQLDLARKVLEEARDGCEVFQAVRHFPLAQGGYVPKYILVHVYHDLVQRGEWPENPALLARIRMKPVRTLSGVTTVTVLTKPYPCPGKCIFCPTDVRMPKSYLPDEPGARRGLQNNFDPYNQVFSRLDALHAVGHPLDKIELLILGGTWSAYRRDYQEWFVRRCFDALNGTDSASLEEAQTLNESASHRNVGLVIETRPDEISADEIVWLRKLGVTKLQLGAQSLDDRVLEMNKRGHTVDQLRQAVALLRAASFKVVLHWMPNLLGATPESDRIDFDRLWAGGFCPDEIKIYPTQLLANAELFDYWQRGEYQPYSTEQLVQLIADIKPSIPIYCRVNRVIRDIPSTNVVEGNRRTSLRQDVMIELARRGQSCRCIRCREVREQEVELADLQLQDEIYHPVYAEEHFLSFVTPDDRIAGYLRLSLPEPCLPCEDGEASRKETAQWQALHEKLTDLAGAALIREVHVYGQSLAVGAEQSGAAQHIGLGKALLRAAEEIAGQHGFNRLAVIAAVGTRQYYESRGFTRGEYYLVKEIRPQR